MSLLHRRAGRRSCCLHGDNGCENQGEAGPRQRAQDKRVWREDIAAEMPANLRPAQIEAYTLVRGYLTEMQRSGKLYEPGGQMMRGFLSFIVEPDCSDVVARLISTKTAKSTFDDWRRFFPA